MSNPFEVLSKAGIQFWCRNKPYRLEAGRYGNGRGQSSSRACMKLTTFISSQ